MTSIHLMLEVLTLAIAVDNGIDEPYSNWSGSFPWYLTSVVDAYKAIV